MAGVGGCGSSSGHVGKVHKLSPWECFFFLFLYREEEPPKGSLSQLGVISAPNTITLDIAV